MDSKLKIEIINEIDKILFPTEIIKKFADLAFKAHSEKGLSIRLATQSITEEMILIRKKMMRELGKYFVNIEELSQEDFNIIFKE